MRNRSTGQMTKYKVLEIATQLINEKGFSKTSINDIVRATGVKKGNLYFHFSSKDELGLAVLEKAKRDFSTFLRASLRGENPIDRLSNFLDAVFEKHRRARFVGGCLFGNTALELSDSNDVFTQFLAEVFQEWVESLAEVVREAYESGDLKAQFPPNVLAKHIVASIEGGIMMSRLTKNGDHLRDCLNALRISLGIDQK